MERALEPTRRESILDRPLSELISLNWELAAYGAILLLAVVTRFWDLGSRAMSHDESLHVFYSWKLYAGEGYRHDPLMHGPFLFHVNALVYFLFGANDYTARITPALAGVVLVGLPYLLRKWLGRVGALVTSLLLLWSPSILYYSRYIRHDIFAALWTLLMFIALFRYLDSRENRWLYIGAAAVALALSTKEVAYIHGFIGVTFVLVAMLWEWAGEERGQFLAGVGTIAWALLVSLWMFIIRGTLGPLTTTVDGTIQKTLLGKTYPLLMFAAGYLLAALFVGSLLRREQVKERTWAVIRAVDRNALLISVAIVVVIFTLLHTTFFTNRNGLYSGTIGAISYWLAQQEVQRGSQPWYYYLLLLPLYEFLPLLFGLAGTAWYLLTDRWPRRGEGPAGRLFVPILIYWWLTALVTYSWAGEKMPWLTVHMALPLILLAGRVIGDLLEAADWQAIWRRGGGLLALLLVPTVIVLGVWIGIRPFQGLSIQDLAATTQWLAALVILFVLLWAIARRVRVLGRRNAGFVVLATFLALLYVLTIRTSWMASYINDELATEYIVYAHATPDDKMVVEEIDRLAERLNLGYEMKISYDAEVVWPFEWYLRDYRNRHYFGEVPNAPLDAPVVMIGTKNEAKIKPFLGDRYVRREYKMRWWPDESYKGLTPQRVLDILRDPERRRRVWDVIWRRKYVNPLNRWPHLDRFALYVRKDVVSQIWEYGAAAPELAAVKDVYTERRITLTALRAIGSQGSGPGQLLRPKDVALDADGNLYVADSGNHRIVVFSPDGKFLRAWGRQGAANGEFNEPWGIAVDAERGFVYVADTWNHRIQKFDLKGTFITQWGSGTIVDTGGQAVGFEGQFFGPRDIAIDAEGNLYVTDTGNERVQKFDPDGNFLAQWGGDGTAPGMFKEPVGIAISPTSGDIFIADTWNRRVQRFDKDFNPIAQWFVQGWESQSVVNKPYIAVDAQDNVYVTDPESFRVIQFNNRGDVLAVWGDFGAGLNQMNLPTGIAIGLNGEIYVGDSENHRVLEFPARIGAE